MYYYYNSRTTNESSPVIIYRTAPTVYSIHKQVRDLKKLYPKHYKYNDIIKVFTKETEDGALLLVGSYVFKRLRLTKCSTDISTIFVTQWHFYLTF